LRRDGPLSAVWDYLSRELLETMCDRTVPCMTRTWFLGLSTLIAFAVASFALGFPDALLVGKGVVPSPATVVWVREVGVLILASGVTTLLSRRAPDSLALRGVLVGNAVVHFGLFPIELLAFNQGVISEFAGVAPNSLLHLVLSSGFVFYARRVRV
jgi:hypothetical protein